MSDAQKSLSDLHTVIILILCLFLIFQLGLSYWISTRIESQSEYLKGALNIGPVFLGISLFATWFGAETCIGTSSAVYQWGLSGSRADPFGYSLCLFLSALLIAPRIWNSGYVTLADFYTQRFGKNVAAIAAWLLAISSLMWGAAQLRGFGGIIEQITPFSAPMALSAGLLFVILYTSLAGLSGDIISDIIQGVIIAIGLFILLAIVLQKPEVTWINFQQMPAERFSFLAQKESWLHRIERWSIPVLGSLVAQEIVARILSAQKKSDGVKACWIGGGVYILLGSIPVIIGLVGPLIHQVSATNSESFLISLLKAQTSPWLTGIVGASLVAALLSSIDSILLSAGGLISKNYLIPRLRLKPKNHLIVTRIIVVLCAIIAFVLALYSTSILELLEQSSTFGTSGILVITLFGLWFPLGNEITAYGTLICGIVTQLVLKFIFEVEAPFVMGLLVSTVYYLVHGYSLKLRPSQTLHKTQI